MFMNKKIAELLGPLDNTIINIIFDINFLSEKFKVFKEVEILKTCYEKTYNKYSKLYKSLSTEPLSNHNDNNSSDESSDMIDSI